MRGKKHIFVILDEETHKRLKIKLATMGITISDWLRKKVNEEVGTAENKQ